MNQEDFRNYCLGLGDVTEKMPFGKFARRYDSILAFYVSGHMFCFVDIEDFAWMDIRLTADEVTALREQYVSAGDPVNQSPRYWIKVNFDGDVPERVVWKLVKRAYEVVSGKYKKS